MKYWLPFALLLALPFAPATAQLTVTGSGTSLTMTGSSTLHAQNVTVDNGADLDVNGTARVTGTVVTLAGGANLTLVGSNTELNATTLIVTENNTLLLLAGSLADVTATNIRVDMDAILRASGSSQGITANSTLTVGELGTLDAPGVQTVISADDIIIEDEGVLTLPNTADEVLSFDNFRIDDGGIFTLRGYGEFDKLDWNGDVVFQIGGDQSTGDFGNTLVQGASDINVNGTVTTELVNGYAPTTGQVYRLIDVDNQFASAGFMAVTPSGDWTYDIEQNYVDIIFDATSLPVEWLSFTGRWAGKAAQLDWVTGTESGSSHFEVERQNAAGAWQNIGRVEAAVESLSPRDYAFLDETPGPTNPVLYRLRQMDLDGGESYSTIVSLQRDGFNAGVHLFPNPVSELLTVTGLPEGDYAITDVAGREVLRGRTTAERTQIAIPADLPTGSYVLRGAGGGAYRFVVQR